MTPTDTILPDAGPHTRRAAQILGSLGLALAIACGGGEEGAPAEGAAAGAQAAPGAGSGNGEEAPRVRGAAEVLRENPCVFEARAMISEELHKNQRYQDQLQLLESGTRRCPDTLEIQNDFAYVLATVPQDELRDGKRALEIAKQVVAKHPEDPAYLDTLAAAYAETGAFDEAVKYSEQAIAQLEKLEAPDEMLAVFKAHRDSFAAGKPIRE